MVSNFNKKYTKKQAVYLIAITLMPLTLLALAILSGFSLPHNTPFNIIILLIVLSCIYAKIAYWIAYKGGILEDGITPSLSDKLSKNKIAKQKSIVLQLYDTIFNYLNVLVQRKDSNSNFKNKKSLLWGVFSPDGIAAVLTVICVLMFILFVFAIVYIASIFYYEK